MSDDGRSSNGARILLPAIARATRLARYVRAAAIHPALRQRRLTLGPRCHFELGPAAQLTFGSDCTFAGDFRAVVMGSLTLGDRVFVNHGAHISVMSSVQIGSDCRFGERLSIHDEDHVFHASGDISEDYRTDPVVIGDNVWVGANTTILRGTHIGSHSVVAAGAVVRGRFDQGKVLLAGVPARVVRSLAN